MPNCSTLAVFRPVPLIPVVIDGKPRSRRPRATGDLAAPSGTRGVVWKDVTGCLKRAKTCKSVQRLQTTKMCKNYPKYSISWQIHHPQRYSVDLRAEIDSIQCHVLSAGIPHTMPLYRTPHATIPLYWHQVTTPRKSSICIDKNPVKIKDLGVPETREITN